MREKLYFAKLRPEAVIPSKRDEDAGYDIYACFDEDYLLFVTKQGTVKRVELAACTVSPTWRVPSVRRP